MSINSCNVRPKGRLASAICLALGAATAPAATITVNSNDDDAASTFCNLRNALISINSGDTRFTPTCASAMNGVFGDNDEVLFSDALAGATITLTQGQLAISGATAAIIGSGQTINAAGNSRVFAVNVFGTAMLSNLTLTGGHSATYGGAIQVDADSTLTLTDCIVSNSSANTHGGGIFAILGTITLNRSTLTGNTATKLGGGIYASGGALELMSSTISNNTATMDRGGGINSMNGNVLAIDHSTLSGNTGYRSGAIYLRQGVATITASTISGNTGNCGESCAGAIYTWGSDLFIIGSTLAGNTARGAVDFQAGGLYLYNANATLINSTITGNSAAGNNYLAGAVWELHKPSSTKGKLTLINSTISANTASSYISGTYVGGGIDVGISGTGTNVGAATMNNTIVSSNIPANSDIVFGATSTTWTAAYNLLGLAQNVSQFNVPADHNLFSDTPGLGPLQNNGGPTQTMALMLGSPAIGAGNSTSATYSGQPLNYDQRGTSYERTFGNTVDIGAFEDQRDRIFANGTEAEP